MLSVDFVVRWYQVRRSTVALLAEDVLSNFLERTKEGRNDEWMGG